MNTLRKTNKDTKFFILFFILSVFLQCKEKKYSAEEIYTEFSPAVVLIIHDFYYEANFNDFSVYFVPDDEGSGLKFVENEQIAKENSASISGTGFFINEKGVIATNRHVAFPLPSEQEQSNIKEYFGNLKYKLLKSKNELESKKNQLVDIYYKRYDLLSFDDVNTIRTRLKEYSDKITEISNLTSQLNYDKYDIKIDVKTISIKIGYNDTYIEDDNDLFECVKLIKSDKKDLALIQLKSKKTPIEVKPIEVVNLNEKPNLDVKVFMIGFNSGISLAQTKEGIKSQITSGNITQKPDEEKVLYSIPTLRGSSGSPIINDQGELMCINYAKQAESQGFSFGVPVSHLVNLVNENRIDITNNIVIGKPQHSIKKEKFIIDIEPNPPKISKKKKTINKIETNPPINRNDEFPKKGIINASKVNVRPQASTNNTPLNVTLKFNQKVTILDFVNNAEREFLLTKEVNCNVDGRMIRLNKGKSIINYECNNQTAMCKIKFHDGSKYLTGYIPEDSITEKNSSWYKIQTDEGQIGWVYAVYITEIKLPEQTRY